MATIDQARRTLEDADQRIDWILQHASMSPWLKETLRGARGCDPIDLLNDLEIICVLLRRRASAQDAARSPERRESDR